VEFKIDGPNSLLGDLAVLDQWLASMGVPGRSTDRIHRLIQLLTELNPRNVGAALEITQEERRLYMYSLAELVEFHQVFTWLNEEDPRVLGPKLIRALSGSVDPFEESSSNSVGRNTMFELSLASEWRRAGLKVAIGEPDLQLVLGQQEFLVECKRPFDWTGVVRCLKNASRQLKRSGALTKPGAPKGVIAISLSRIIAGGEQILLAGSMGDKSKLQEIIEHELAANRWRWWTRIRFDESIAAVLFHLSLPADVGHGDHFALLSFSNVYQACVNHEALALLNQAMEPLYRDAAPGSMKVHVPVS